MNEVCRMKAMITENGLNYVLVGDYYFPLLTLPEEKRSIGKLRITPGYARGIFC